MKLTDTTLTVLKNFSTINEGIYVNRGNILQTVSKQKNILAKAVVSETFEDEFGIYDLNNFLGVLTLQKGETADLDFEDKNIIIKNMSGRSKIKYRKAAKETILVPPDKEVKMTDDIKFTLTAADFAWISRVAITLGSPNIAFISDGKSIRMETFNAKDDSAHVNSTEIEGINSTGVVYRMIFSTENLGLLSGDYDVTISSKGISHFKNKTLPVEYWITTENGSKYGE